MFSIVCTIIENWRCKNSGLIAELILRNTITNNIHNYKIR